MFIGPTNQQIRSKKTILSSAENFGSRSVSLSKDAGVGTAIALPPLALVGSGQGGSISYNVGKRATDVAVAGVLLAILSGLFALIALLVVLEDRGPIFYWQTRVGRNGKTFRFYKFRSMVANADALKASLAQHNEADGPAFKMRRDPRVTRIGRVLRKYSLDELPQLLNVLRGEMSLVGPRPHLPTEVKQYVGEQAERLTVQPGLVCLREVSGRSHLTFEHWVELDLIYIKNRCLCLDSYILLRLLPAVLRAEGAF